jgi:hypothetical protein
VVTRANVEAVWPRETDRAAGSRIYAELVRSRFVDLVALAKPLPP